MSYCDPDGRIFAKKDHKRQTKRCKKEHVVTIVAKFDKSRNLEYFIKFFSKYDTKRLTTQ